MQEGQTALMIACQEENSSLACMLISAGAQVRAIKKENRERETERDSLVFEVLVYWFVGLFVFS